MAVIASPAALAGAPRPALRPLMEATVLLALLALVPLASTLLDDSYLTTLATRIVIMALLAMSLDLVLGYGGLVSFGHAAFFGLGGYTVGILAFHLEDGTPIFGFAGSTSGLVTVPLAMAVSALAALVIGFLSLRTRGVHFIMITLAFAQMIFFVFVGLKYYGGDDGLILTARNMVPGVDLTDPTSFYYACLFVLVLVFLGLKRLTYSRFGMVLRGSKMSERRMRALGYNVTHYRLVAFVISGALAGLAGALAANEARFVSPEMLSWMRSGEVIIMVVLGGVGTLIGPILGAAAFVLLEMGLSDLTEHWMLILGPILVLVVLLLEGGLLSLLGKVRR
jgi:ABC-type branched-chain amino acid transport system, permease component